MATPADDEAGLLTFTEDRYNGVELKVPPTAAAHAMPRPATRAPQ